MELLLTLIIAAVLLPWFPFAQFRNHLFGKILAVLFICLFTFGCEASSDQASTSEDTTKEETSAETTNEAETESETKTSSTSNFSIEEDALHDLPLASVTRVIDGDTIEINLNGKTEDVRLLLVDTPETKHPDLPVQPYGPKASQFAEETLNGKEVRVEYDGPKRDKYNRLLAYLWVDGENFNQMLLKEGLARLAYVYDPPYTHYDSFVKAQTKAANANKNIWSINGYVTESGFSKKQPPSDAGNKRKTSSYIGPYDPNGPDRNCGDFKTQQDAQAFFDAAGGPSRDPHRLDGNDNDGLVCESLP
ncbi:thermonuclease family protein [Halobacillus sp. BBL2006]|uniref:thermonuclease family protein n=1 Tax=Halobacillus sp. BBL2006 TaxID=1543706 RepID=UPI0006897C98|nr:thermonuclease family protein [Halobacillus sp. BBL2006]